VWERPFSRTDSVSTIELMGISSIAINFLQQEFSKANDVGIAFVYFDYKSTITLDDIIGSLLKHLVHRNAHISKELTDLYLEHMKRGTHLTYMELAKILEAESRNVSQVFVVFDALDECTIQDDTHTKILEELRRLPTVRLMITGRPHVTAICKS
jgi:methionine synthase II (cobalamin-independent)